MTINSTIRTAGPYIGNDAATVFPFYFKVFDKKDVQVVRTNTQTGISYSQNLDSDYTVTLNADQDSNPGGSVTLAVPLQYFYTLVLTSQLDYLQPLDLTNQGGFYPKVITDVLDRIVIFIQQLASIANRSLRFPVADTGVNTELPQRSSRANNLLGFDANGNPIAVAPNAQSATALQTLLATVGATMVGFIQAGVGAVIRTIQSRMRDKVSLFDYMTQAQIDDVRARAFTLDVTAPVQQALTYAASIRASAVAPAGLYKINPTTVFADEDTSYVTLAAFIMASHLHVEAEPGAVFKIADGVSTDAAPKSMGMFCTNQVLSNVSIRGLDMDMNGANNPISPARPVTYNRFNQSPILVSGTPGGVAGRIDDMVVEKCTFRNNPGVCSIVAAQSNTAGTVLGKNWRILKNKFINNGLDTDDHTAVFAWADDVLCFGNEFTNDTPNSTVGKTGGNTAYEIHGSRHRFLANHVKNYLRGLWVSSNLTAAEVVDNIISANHFETTFYGVDFFRTAATLSQPKNTLIAGNTFRFDGYTCAGAPQQKCCVNIASEYAQSGVLIEGNTAVSTDSVVGSVFLTVTPQTVVGQTHDNIICRGNKARGFVTGAVVRTNATNGLGYLAIEDNTWSAPLTTPTFAVAIGEFIDPVSPIKTLVLSGNRMIDEQAVPKAQYGTYIQAGTITDFYYSGAFGKGLSGALYYEAGAVDGNKIGTFESQVLTPAFKAGGAALTLGNGSTTGRYSFRGKEVFVAASLTIGSTTVIPAGSLTLDLPVPSGIAGVQYLGNWRIFDSSAGAFYFGWGEIDGTSGQMTLQVNGGTFATTATPVPLATGDVISVQIIYQRP